MARIIIADADPITRKGLRCALQDVPGFKVEAEATDGCELLAILACPLDKQPVKREGNYLVCQECQRHYPIREGIPVMLIDEALTPEQAASTMA